MFEKKSGIFLIAGLGFFFFAFLSNGLVAWLMYADLPEKTVEQLVHEQVTNPDRSWTVMTEFKNLHTRYPEAFEKHYGQPNEESLAKALRRGRSIYIGEGCWHCHSQFVRPVANEDRRWGPVSRSWEYQNELQRPVMFGTRRVGPDLSREGGRRSNDWHVVHFFRPRLATPQSVMPDYPWFFDGEEEQSAILDDRGKPLRGPGPPNERGIAIITYMQWLGSWLDQAPHYGDPHTGPTLSYSTKVKP
jgi:hypothetical protein